MTTTLSPLHDVPFEDFDRQSDEARQEAYVGDPEPDRELIHPPAFRSFTLNDDGGRISNPCGYTPGVW